jgi:hypothetical protein
MAPPKRDFPTEWTIWCEEGEDRARDGQRDDTEAQEAIPTGEGGIQTSPPGPDSKKKSETWSFY